MLIMKNKILKNNVIFLLLWLSGISLMLFHKNIGFPEKYVFATILVIGIVGAVMTIIQAKEIFWKE
jgi:hypothetical protein